MASPLENFVNKVRTFSAQGQFTQLTDFINSQWEMLSKAGGQLNTALATLDAQNHALGILAILVSKQRNSQNQDYDLLLKQCSDFVMQCNGEHVRMIPALFAELLHNVTSAVVKKGEALRAVPVLVTAINKLQKDRAQLTSLHADLCQLCLTAKCMKPALEFLDVDIVDINSEGSTFDARALLLYYYYGGMIYTALKQWDRALFFFEMAVTTPANAVSHIMVEAYKKHVLIGLLHSGKIPTLPKFTSQVVMRYIKPMSTAYNDLATAYTSGSSRDLEAVITKHQQIYNRDQNMGLMKQCQISLYRRNIRKLTKTFLTLSLADVASRVELEGPRQAEHHLLHMIECGEIYACINQKDGMVEFKDSPEQYSSAEMMKHIDAQMEKCMALDKKVREMDTEISVNPQFVRKSIGLHDDDLPGSSVGKYTGFNM